MCRWIREEPSYCSKQYVDSYQSTTVAMSKNRSLKTVLDLCYYLYSRSFCIMCSSSSRHGKIYFCSYLLINSSDKSHHEVIDPLEPTAFIFIISVSFFFFLLFFLGGKALIGSCMHGDALSINVKQHYMHQHTHPNGEKLIQHKVLYFGVYLGFRHGE
jgi:hypothetical protein